MAKNNYGYEKRQKEIAKQKKKEEKLRKKQDRKGDPAFDENDQDESGAIPEGTDDASA